MPRVIEILRHHLMAGGFDGLVEVDAQCGCLLENLAPCSSDFGQCEPGFRGVDINEADEWAVYRTKAGALDSVAKVRALNPDGSDLGPLCETRVDERDPPKPEPQRQTLRGFGVTITPGAARNWYVGADGVKRWANNDSPVSAA